MLKELVRKTRSYRRFEETYRIDMDTLNDLIALARLAASGRNLQPLKYILSVDPVLNEAIFPHLSWAHYLKDWPGPATGQRPAAYIVILHDKEISEDPRIDPGIACQNILLGAVEKGLGGCILGNINREALRKLLNVLPRYDVLYIVALGKPAEEVVIDDLCPGGSIEYYRDGNDVHHVPKRTLDEIIIEMYSEQT